MRRTGADILQRAARTAARLSRDDSGVSLIEYCLLAALITLVCIVTLGLLGGSVSDMYTKVNGAVP